MIYGPGRRRAAPVPGIRPLVLLEPNARAVFGAGANAEKVPLHAVDNADSKVIAQTVSFILSLFLIPIPTTRTVIGGYWEVHRVVRPVNASIKLRCGGASTFEQLFI